MEVWSLGLSSLRSGTLGLGLDIQGAGRNGFAGQGLIAITISAAITKTFGSCDRRIGQFVQAGTVLLSLVVKS